MTKRQRLALGITYRGNHYHGWQTQRNKPTIQHALEQALSCIANHPVTTVCAGRTDACVHATGQVVHFDVEQSRGERAWTKGVNSNLPKDISVSWVKETPDDFHARFSALARCYRYFIYNHSLRPALLMGHVAWVYRPLRADLMHYAAQSLLGEHDFTAFRGSGCQSATAMRCVYYLNVTRQSHIIVIDIKANAFLLHMVRNIVGALLEVGWMRRPPEWLQTVLESRERTLAGASAPPDGLYLTQVDYPLRYNVPVGSDIGFVYTS